MPLRKKDETDENVLLIRKYQENWTYEIMERPYKKGQGGDLCFGRSILWQICDKNDFMSEKLGSKDDGANVGRFFKT